MSKKLSFEISKDVPFTSEEVERVFENIHNLIGDLDSSGGLLVNDSGSVEEELRNGNIDVPEEIYEGLEEVEEMFNVVTVEDIETVSDLFADCFDANATGDPKQLHSKTGDALVHLEMILARYETLVVDSLDTTDYNVGYAHSYLQRMVETAEKLKKDANILYN